MGGEGKFERWKSYWRGTILMHGGEKELCRERERPKREENNGEGRLSTSRLCLSGHKIVRRHLINSKHSGCHWNTISPYRAGATMAPGAASEPPLPANQISQ